VSTNKLLPVAEVMNGSAWSFEAIHFSDLDGDALPDILQQVFVQPNHPLWGVRKNKGGGEFEDGILTQVDAFCGDAARVIDADGDGRAEVWSASTFGCGESATMAWGSDDQPVVNPQPGLGFEARRAMFADLNGDGLRDIVRPGSPGWVRWSMGAGLWSKARPHERAVPGRERDGRDGPGMSVVDLNATAGRISSRSV
jgi:hypothetical protein